MKQSSWSDFGLAALWYKKSEKTFHRAVIQFLKIGIWVITLVFYKILFLFYNTGPVVDKFYTDCMVILILQVFPFHVSKPPASLG